MKIKLTHKEAHLLNAILWELGEEQRGVVHADTVWRLSTEGEDLARSVASKLDVAQIADNLKRGKSRDLSGAPKGTILDAVWKS